MAKQKFRCVGIMRKTGQRVSAVISADDQAAARQIADRNGVTVESLTIVRDSAPPRIAEVFVDEQDDQDVMDRIDEIIKADDDDLDDDLADFDDELSPGHPATKACPYCGEQILAVAIKCKHCGTYLGKKAALTAGGAPLQSSIPKRSSSRGMWTTVGVATGVVVVGLVVIVVLKNILVSPEPSVTPAAPVASAPQPSSPPVKKEKAPSAEEIAFAAKLAAFLDGADETARLLEGEPKADDCLKQYEALKKLSAAIPPPPNVPWAMTAAASSNKILYTVGIVQSAFASRSMSDDILRDFLPSAGDTPELRQALRAHAESLRQLVSDVRAQIPPACLAKPK